MCLYVILVGTNSSFERILAQYAMWGHTLKPLFIPLIQKHFPTNGCCWKTFKIIRFSKHRFPHNTYCSLVLGIKKCSIRKNMFVLCKCGAIMTSSVHDTQSANSGTWNESWHPPYDQTTVTICIHT